MEVQGALRLLWLLLLAVQKSKFSFKFYSFLNYNNNCYSCHTIF